MNPILYKYLQGSESQLTVPKDYSPTSDTTFNNLTPWANLLLTHGAYITFLISQIRIQIEVKANTWDM